jgi:N-acetylmuramoyl-L-alanine amidase
MRVAIRGGHSLDVRGASAILDEVTENRKITAKVIEYLQQLGHEVLDVTPENSGTKSNDLSIPVNTANDWGADYFCSVHLNCSDGVGFGTEVLYKSEKGKEYADKIVAKLAVLGFKNRGSKLDERGLYEFNHTIMPNNIIEVCFIDNQNDVDLYNSIGIDRIAIAIAEGITGETIQSQPEEPTQPTLDMSRLPLDFNEQFYRYANPDVDKAIKDGIFPSASYHYCLYGYSDKPTRIYKPTLPNDWSSDGYMSLNEDIRQAVENKSIPSPSWHWIVQGWIENSKNNNDRKYKYNDDPAIFYGEVHQEIPNLVVIEAVDEVEETKTPIMGKAILSAEQMVTCLLKNNPQPKLNGMNPLEFCKLYIEEGEIEGVRGDIAFCQSIHETGWFQFKGDVTEDQMNYAGIGTVGGGVKGYYFNSQRDGIRVQIQHLKAYSSTEPLKQECIDPRYNLVEPKGKAPTVESLGGLWAVPGYDTNQYSSFEEAYKAKQTYGQMIMSVYDRMASTEVDEDLIKSLQPVVEVPSEKPVEIVNNNEELVRLQTKLNNTIQELEALRINIDNIINNLK